MAALACKAATSLHGAIAVGDINVQIGGFFSQGWLSSISPCRMLCRVTSSEYDLEGMGAAVF
ncbi:MAG TPA: hypothetical protein VMM36_09635 [Opitutaceae bacterium]|nr:hypothetical protein [Opitutaceae bacterium]